MPMKEGRMKTTRGQMTGVLLGLEATFRSWVASGGNNPSY